MSAIPSALPGWTVQLLTGDQARAEAPDLFIEDDGQYFNELAAHGNAVWVDYWPDLVLLVRNAKGEVAVASNASEWNMLELGATIVGQAEARLAERAEATCPHGTPLTDPHCQGCDGIRDGLEDLRQAIADEEYERIMVERYEEPYYYNGDDT